ncbi:cytochrome c biogenesis CcdA family protein [Fibrobacterota bacterium]
MTVYFFGSSTCGECQEIKQVILEPLSAKYPDKLSIEYHNIDDKKSFQLLVKFEKEYNVIEAYPQELFLPDTFLAGYEPIIVSTEELIEKYLSNPDKWIKKNTEIDTSLYKQDLEKKIDKFTFLGVFLAGLIDGVNPCAIATMIFLISFLATQKRKRLEVLVIGLSFTAAVFITYLLIGLSAFRVLTALDQYYWISEVIRWSAVALAGIVAILSFIDAFSYGKSGKTDTIKLQLPKPIKLKIHKIISGNLSGTQLVTGAIITGFLVTLLEAICTGQVYLPTIVLMTKSAGFHLRGWLYLIFYNFLFVLPLLIVMVFAYYGMKWSELAKTTQKHLTLIKILFGVILGTLAVFLAVAG